MRHVCNKLLTTYLLIGCVSCTVIAAPPNPKGKTKGAQRAMGNETSAQSQSHKDPNYAQQKSKLSPEQYRVTQQCGTEAPFQNAFWNHHEDGIYVDVVSGEPLFSSLDKFDSGTGWPSFSKPLSAPNIVAKSDSSHGMTRTEVRSKNADSHLGHVFEGEGRSATGMRYCINSASLKFVPAAQLVEQGYAQFASLFPKVQQTQEVIIMAGGCFWGMEELLRKIPGVVDTEVGYTGGTLKNPRYEDVKTGHTGHAEAVRIVIDPKKTSYETILTFFFRMHDPTTINRQGNDVGTQYRSAIFYTSDKQKHIAEEIKQRVDKSGKWKAPIITQIVPAGPFYPAEGYHQDYLLNNPGGYTCHFLRD